MKNKLKVLVSPSSFGQCGATPLSMLEAEGYLPIINPFGRKLEEGETIELGRDCIGIVAGVEKLNRHVLDQLPALRCISRVGVGMDSIDLAHAEGKGIFLCNTPDGPRQAVAELALTLALNLLRRVAIADRNIRAGIWKKEIGNLLQGKKIGILGLGNIGKSVARLFQSLGNDVLATDIHVDDSWIGQHNVQMVDPETLFATCDIVSIHIPGDPSGKPIVDSRLLNHMQPGAFLINLARGGVVDENALYACLKAGRIAGAAVDVFVQEPYSGDLKKLENVILTPHLGSYAKEAKLQMEIDAVQNLIHALTQ